MSSARKTKLAASNSAASDSNPWSASQTATLPPPPLAREDLAYYVRHHLNETERLLIMLRYAEELGFDEIASLLDMAQQEVEQLHQLIVNRLKESLSSCEALAGV